jgi:uncharacterized membrane protein YdjX (TVP38/TMEM64 family)
MHLFKLHIKQFIFLLVLVALLVFTGFLGKQIGYHRVISFIEEQRSFGAIVYVGYTVLSEIILPLPVVPLWPVALFLYGFWPTIFLTLLGSLAGASVTFYLARAFGKPLVIKMLGKKIFWEIEHLINIDNTRTFLLVRFFGNNYFDAISYIAGLSNLPFKKYISITTLGSFSWLFCVLLIMQKLGGIENMKSLVSIMGLYGTLILGGTLIWEMFHKYHRIGKLRKKRR